MGLDLVVEGCAKPGFEPEWRGLLERAFNDEELSETDIARFQDISIPGYQRVGDPQVGFDAAADAWIIEARKAETPEAVAAVLKEFHGYYVLRLVSCDGVPLYSNGGLYDGADQTSFRGAFLNDCGDVLSKDLLNEAWNHKYPDAAVSYGRALLGAAETAETSGLAPRQQQGFWSRIRLAKNKDTGPPFRPARYRAGSRPLVYLLG